MSTNQILSFFWKAEFADGAVISEYDETGKQYIIKEHLTPRLQAIQDDPDVSIIGKNVFELPEQEHGRVVKFSWCSFTKELAAKVESLNSGFQVAASNGETVEEFVVPEDCYPLFHRELSVTYLGGNKPESKPKAINAALCRRNDEDKQKHEKKTHVIVEGSLKRTEIDFKKK